MGDQKQRKHGYWLNNIELVQINLQIYIVLKKVSPFSERTEPFLHLTEKSIHLKQNWLNQKKSGNR